MPQRSLLTSTVSPSQDKLAELTLQHTNLQELLGALKDDPAHSAARLTEWHSKLGELRLKEMRTVRENERCVRVCGCGGVDCHRERGLCTG